MRLSPTVLLLLALLASHMLLRAGLGFGAGSPDLAMVVVLVGSRLMTMRSAAAMGFAVGLAEDALAMTSFGAFAFATTLAGAGGARFRDFFVDESLPFLAIYVLLGKWGRDVVAWSVSGPARPEFVRHVLVDSLVAAAYAAVVGAVLLLCFPMLSRSRQ